MTKVSKYLISEEIKMRMFEVFWKTIADLKTTPAVEDFFGELLTPTEQIMLAKRLAISILLYKKYSYEEIIDLLKVSPVTIGHVARWLKTGGKAFQEAIEKIIKQEKQEEFWDHLEQFFSDIIPPGKGTNWKITRSEQFKRLRTRRYKRGLL